jgi:signal transduction histidine kinase
LELKAVQPDDQEECPGVLISERFVAKSRVSPVSQIENLSLSKLQYGDRSFLALMKNFAIFVYWGAYRAHGVHLLTMIDDILDMSKIDAGKIDLNEGTVDIVRAVAGCCRTMRQRAADAGVNLLSNAVKFTPSGGSLFDGERVGGSAGRSRAGA